MNYATNYDVGDRKRASGINEDSIAVTVFEDGHRDGFRGQREDVAGAEWPATRSAAAFVLADGAGGHDAGDVASYIATARISEELAPVAVSAAGRNPGAFGVDLDETPPAPSAIRAAIEEAIQSAHRDIVEHANETGAGAYTTVVAGVAVDGQLHYGWVGDSRAYVVNTVRENVARLTEDHAVVEQLVADGEVDEVAAHVHPRGNEITRALGGRGDPETASVAVETDSVPLFAEDVLLVTSDGLPDAQTDAPDLYEEYVDTDRSEAVAELVREEVVTDEDVRDWVLEADSLADAASSLLAAANDRGGKDNLSVILTRDPALDTTPETLPVRARNPHPLESRDTVVRKE